MSALEKPRISPAKLALAVKRLRAEKEDLDLIASDPIAVIGMGCRFPGGGNSPEEFWTALKEGRDGVGQIPEGRWKDVVSLPLQLKRGAYLPEIDGFDAAFFGISPREAQLMDPQQRLLLEVTWEALWDAGIDPAGLAGTDAGAFIAIYNNDYARLHFRDTSALSAHGGIGSAHSVAAGRVSFLLNLKGPSLAIDSACSSSLVATHLACQSLRSRECGLAIVGASSLKTLSDEVIVFSKWGMLSSDGKCKTFDASADGFVPGEGSGVLILKRLSDALQDGDRVRAVIRGTAVNHDGKTTVLTAPNGLAQEAVLRAALKNAMLGPGDISYVETHGTGTSLGDPIEIEAVSTVYGTADGEQDLGAPVCLLGAVKTNLGHLEAAAGIAGIIKTVLCLEHAEIPRNLHFRRLNPEISLAGTRLKIATENTPWSRGERARAAGVSSFGLGGTNGHVILEEAPLLPSQNAAGGRAIPLPAYGWKRERFWMPEVPVTKRVSQEAAKAHAAGAKLVHPLLGRAIDSAFIKGRLFESDLNTTTVAYLDEHSLKARPILPFAAFLEIASAAIGQLDNSQINSIRNFVVREPLFLSADPCKLQVRVADGSVEIASASGSRWTTHAKAQFQASDNDATVVDLTILKARCRKEISPDALYEALERTGLRYGAAFRTIEAAWSGESESVAHLRLQEEEARNVQEYGLHPALLDGCLQTVVAACGKSNADLFLPMSLDHFELRQTGITEVWVHTKIVANSGDAFSADIAVMDAAGTLVAQLGGLQAKRASDVLLDQLTCGDSASAYELAWRSMPLAVVAARQRSGERWLLVESQEGSCACLTDLLQQQGATCAVVVRGESSSRVAISKAPWTGIVYDARGNENRAEASEWTHPEKNDVEFVLEFVKSLEISKGVAPRLWIVSSSAMAVLPSEEVAVAQAPLWGLARTLMLEHPEISPVLIDVGSDTETVGATQETARMLAAEMDSDGSEPMVAFRGGTRYAARLTKELPRTEMAQKLGIDPSGRLEDLHIEPAVRKHPEAHEVEIEVRASGLNFRDVLTALGMFPARSSVPGAECSGTIVQVGSQVRDLQIGDDVLAFAPASLQTFVNVRREFAARKPARMTFSEAAGIPVVFLTAEYGLHRLAKLSAGQRILIHAAAGGLGLAAVQLAMRAGAQVFATAGHPGKRAFLKELGVKHIFDSRSLLFRDEILHATGGAGVEIVLNSLAGDFVRASLDVVAEGGCFLEVGKRDIWSAEEVAVLGRHTRYFPFDLGEVATREPELIAMMLSELMARFSSGELQPLPTTLYSFDDSARAFRTMAQARHIGKIVLGLSGTNRGHKVGEVVSDGTVLITGGLGALGLQLAQWLAAQGARNIVLAGRSASDGGENAIVAELRKQGVDVAVECVDVASSDQLHDLLDRIRATRPSLCAVFHAAGVLHDAVLNKESWASYCETTAPKIQGAWNLDRLTQQDPVRLMVFFSSAASILGSPGQGGYSAGNAFLDALAHRRSSRGLATLSVNWGAWASAGMAARLAPEQAARWTRQGAKPMEPQAALAALGAAIEAGRTQVGIMEMDWKQFRGAASARGDASFFSELQPHESDGNQESPCDSIPGDNILESLRSAPEFERKFLLSAHIKACARRVLGLKDSAVIQDGVALQDLGLDSLMALEMRNDLAQSLATTLAAGLLFDYPSVEELTEHLLGIFIPSIEPVAETPIFDDAMDVAAELQLLSDEEAELLLIQELDRAGREKANA